MTRGSAHCGLTLMVFHPTYLNHRKNGRAN
jgi:hypothetical protein